MQLSEIKAIIENYKEAILEDNGIQADRMLMAFAREVERETRHEAMKLAYKLANDINDLKP